MTLKMTCILSGPTGLVAQGSCSRHRKSPNKCRRTQADGPPSETSPTIRVKFAVPQNLQDTQGFLMQHAECTRSIRTDRIIEDKAVATIFVLHGL